MKTYTKFSASRANPEACSGTHALSMLWDDYSAVAQMPDMVALQRAMKALPYDTMVLNEHNESRRDRIWRKVRDVISPVRGSDGAMGLLRSQG